MWSPCPGGPYVLPCGEEQQSNRLHNEPNHRPCQPPLSARATLLRQGNRHGLLTGNTGSGHVPAVGRHDTALAASPWMERQESPREGRAPEENGGLLREECQLCWQRAGYWSLGLEPELEWAATDHSQVCFQEPTSVFVFPSKHRILLLKFTQVF